MPPRRAIPNLIWMTRGMNFGGRWPSGFSDWLGKADVQSYTEFALTIIN
jgi:hypothetical protein